MNLTSTDDTSISPDVVFGGGFIAQPVRYERPEPDASRALEDLLLLRDLAGFGVCAEDLM